MPTPASTVVLARPSPARFDVLLLRRHDRIAFMGGAHVFPGGRVEPSDPGEDDEARHRAAAVRELREEAGVVVAADALAPIAHWVTPEGELKRFDTRFYLARLPDAQTAIHDGTEHTDSLWVDPAAAIALARGGAIALPPPTWMTLRRLAAFASIDEALAWAATHRIARTEPALVERDGARWVTVPGDPPARFVLEQGRWREA